MDLYKFLAEKMSVEMQLHFKAMVDRKVIPLEFMNTKDRQQEMARHLLGELADSLTRHAEENVYLDIAVISFMLFVLGAEPAAEIIQTYQAQPVPAVGIMTATAVPLDEADSTIEDLANTVSNVPAGMRDVSGDVEALKK